MQILQLLFDHFWLVVLFFIFFGGSLWGAIEWMIRRSLKHRERMQELKNEELRLQMQIAQIGSHVPSSPAPKEAAWEEREYHQGYQQQQQQNR